MLEPEKDYLNEESGSFYCHVTFFMRHPGFRRSNLWIHAFAEMTKVRLKNSSTPHLNRIFVGITILFFLFFIPGTFSTFASDELNWQEIKTRYAILCYQASEDLIGFNKKINYSSGISGLGWLTYGGSSKNLEDRLKTKIDAIFQRVQQILDMRKRIDRVRINLYQNKGQLGDEFEDLYHKECYLRAWYAFEKHTIYLNLEDLHEGMLAHEMAHAIIDHYFAMRPPAATAEILARYVDGHLFPK